MHDHRHQGHQGKSPSIKVLLYVSVVSFVAIAFDAAPARAELVFFSTGRSLSVKAHRMDGTSLVLSLRGGGEVVCEASAIARIEPDEVPYPEDERGPIRLKPDPTGVPDPAGAAGAAGVEDAQGLGLSATAQLQSDPRYDPIIEQASARHGVDATLVRAVIQVESNYQYRARSARGARGLMQLMPATARQYGVTNPYDPAANIEAGIKHLKSLLERFPLSLALAAYNAGEAAVQRYGGVPPYAETRTYVDRVLRLVGKRV